MNFILCDYNRTNLLPFTFTRPVADLRMGILTIREKWEHYLNDKTSTITEEYLAHKFPLKKDKESICINACVLPSEKLSQDIKALKPKQQIVHNKVVIAAHVTEDTISSSALSSHGFDGFETLSFTGEITVIENPWDLFVLNEKCIIDDFKIVSKNKKSAPLSKTNTAIGAENIFIEAGAKVECSVINASTGPVYIGKDAEVMEGCLIRGPFSLGEHSVLKMGTKVYGATTIGPHSKVGGEVSNSVIFGYSNKAHDGFLGNSVLGEWCNLGAGTNNSNLKNNYSAVKIWSYAKNNYADTGLKFCGLFMGDHSKCGINTMFNTGTVVGVSANIFGGNFPPKLVPSYSWGGITGGVASYKIDQVLQTVKEVYSRRNKLLEDDDINIIRHLYDLEKENVHKEIYKDLYKSF